MTAQLEELLGGFSPIGLDELDARAALLHRIDTKYVVAWDDFEALCGELRRDHEILEIDGLREFAYASVYFDTSDLRCYWDHVEDRLPRFKARTRLYADTGRCVFEVKLKLDEQELDKRQRPREPDECDSITSADADFLRSTLRERGLRLADPLEPSLRTGFRRITLAPRERKDRLTCDVGVELSRDGAAVRLEPGFVVVETKSEDGRSPADSVLAGRGVEPISLSKYRMGIELLEHPPATEPPPQAARYFSG